MGKISHIHPNPTLTFSTILFLLTLSYSSIHDLMRSRALLAGIFPKNTKSYHLNNDFLLEVHMKEPCLFESMVLFNSVVRANLNYGDHITDQSLSQEDPFLWLPAKDINVCDPSSELTMFDIGLTYKQFALSAFQESYFCVPTGHNLIKDIGMDEVKLRSEQ